MKPHIQILLILVSALLSTETTFAQRKNISEDYQRSSLYSVLVSHNNVQFAKEIEDVFFQIPIPDKFDNHDLSVKITTSEAKKVKLEDVDKFVTTNNFARHMVARWFNRNPETGECDMDLVKLRGLYDASYYDLEMAKNIQRGISMIYDNGENLIGNTFLIVNDIWYNDRSKGAKIAGGVVKGLGTIASIITGISIDNLTDQIGDLISDIEGFGVHVVTYLYRLEWNNEIADEFYSCGYVQRNEKDDAKKTWFDKTELFKLKYIGSSESVSGNTVMGSFSKYDPTVFIKKVCTRAIDESIVKLQREHEEFRIKTPLFDTQVLSAKIGMKEGVSKSSKFEVLQKKIDDKGKVEFHRVGIIKPVDGKIWDNRYLSEEENKAGYDLGFTTFTRISGKEELLPGMLIREI